MHLSGEPKSAAGFPAAKTLQPNIATQSTELSRTNLLNELDSNAQVCSFILVIVGDGGSKERALSILGISDIYVSGGLSRVQ